MEPDTFLIACATAFLLVPLVLHVLLLLRLYRPGGTQKNEGANQALHATSDSAAESSSHEG